MSRAVAGRVCVLVAAWLVAAGLAGASRAHAQDEVRALWVVRTSLTSPADVAAMVSSAKASGFNTLLVQVRGRGDAYYRGGLEPRPVALAGQPGFDPLATVIALAHRDGLQVHAWINVNLVAGVTEMPPAREHVIYRHPEWLMVPRALGEDLAGIDPRSPEYLGRLSRYVRGSSSEIEGLYLSPIPPAAAAYTVSVVRDIVQRYAVDGVHLDYVRYPTADFDYSPAALEQFRANVVRDLKPAERRRYDLRLEREPLIYTQAFPERWRAFRIDRLTALVADLRRTIKAIRPAAAVSAAVVPDPADAARQRLQDWREWLARDLVDVVCPMAYTTDAGVFGAQVAAARAIAGAHPVWAGIGAYRLNANEIISRVRAARRLGAGVILFSYDSLIEPPFGPEYLTQVARAAFTQ